MAVPVPGEGLEKLEILYEDIAGLFAELGVSVNRNVMRLLFFAVICSAVFAEDAQAEQPDKDMLCTLEDGQSFVDEKAASSSLLVNLKSVEPEEVIVDRAIKSPIEVLNGLILKMRELQASRALLSKASLRLDIHDTGDFAHDFNLVEGMMPFVNGDLNLDLEGAVVLPEGLGILYVNLEKTQGFLLRANYEFAALKYTLENFRSILRQFVGAISGVDVLAERNLSCDHMERVFDMYRFEIAANGEVDYLNVMPIMLSNDPLLSAFLDKAVDALIVGGGVNVVDGPVLDQLNTFLDLAVDLAARSDLLDERLGSYAGDYKDKLVSCASTVAERRFFVDVLQEELLGKDQYVWNEQRGEGDRRHWLDQHEHIGLFDRVADGLVRLCKSFGIDFVDMLKLMKEHADSLFEICYVKAENPSGSVQNIEGGKKVVVRGKASKIAGVFIHEMAHLWFDDYCPHLEEGLVDVLENTAVPFIDGKTFYAANGGISYPNSALLVHLLGLPEFALTNAAAFDKLNASANCATGGHLELTPFVDDFMRKYKISPVFYERVKRIFLEPEFQGSKDNVKREVHPDSIKELQGVIEESGYDWAEFLILSEPPNPTYLEKWLAISMPKLAEDVAGRFSAMGL